jgi:hypothetical protein
VLEERGNGDCDDQSLCEGMKEKKGDIRKISATIKISRIFDGDIRRRAFK